MADHPDVHADGLSVNVNPLGITLSFTRTTPAVPNVSKAPRVEVVATVRIARPVAEGVRDVLTKALEGASDQGTQTLTH